MQHKKFRKTQLATSLSLALGLGLFNALPSWADEGEQADQPNNDIEVIEVTGIRSSLVRSMDVKRSANGVVDSISATDIGKFPDTNLAESLQRISGVSIDRVNGEGSKVTVRGFGPEFNLVTLNGRQMPVTTGSRSFDFANLASESVSGVEVYKTSVASQPSGGIGATVNILTHKPLSTPGLVASFSAKALDDKSTDKGNTTPEFSGLYSNTFADDKFGISISGSYQKRESGNRQAMVGTGWRSFPGSVDNSVVDGNSEWGAVPRDNQVNRPGDDDIYSVPQTTIYRFEEQQRKRTNGQLVLQYQPADNLRTTLDYTYMRNDVDTQYHDISAWYTFVPSENVWSDGPIASPLIYSEAYDTPQDLSMAAGDYGVRNQSGSLGFNAKWDVNDSLTLSFDAHHSYAEYKPNNPLGSSNTLSTAAFIRTSAATDFTGDLPVLAVGGGNDVKPSDMRVTGSHFTNTRNRSEIHQYQFNGQYLFDMPASIDFGVSFLEVENRSQERTVQRNDWGGVGQAGDLDDAWFPTESVIDKFDSHGGNFLGNNAFDPLNTMFFWDFHKVRDRAEQLYSNGPGAGDCGSNFCPASDYNNEINRYTKEKSTAAYGQFNYNGELGSMTYDLHLGMRYEKTDVDSVSAVVDYGSASWIADTEVELESAGQIFGSQKGSYDYWLPSVNFNLDVTDDIKMRLAYSKTIGRPDYVSIQGGTVLAPLANKAGGTGTAGNPSLLPLESNNYDFSLEWYYDEGSYASVGYFRKDTKNWITNELRKVTVDGLANPIGGKRYREAVAALGDTDSAKVRQWIFDNYGSDPYVDAANGAITGNPNEDPLMSFNVDTPVNSSRKDTIDGWEFAVQHFFGESGFGIIANYTLVDSNTSYDNFILMDQPALVGLSDTANAVLVYENYGFQARVAYNWRDQFLSSRTQEDTGANPQYVEAYHQVDFSISYDIEAIEGLTVSLEGINVTNEPTRVHGRAKEQVLNLTETGERYALGVHYSF
ncbi:MAG: TonB-dependent receptor [Pseudomonadota bacterium]|uniref:TonB-dependent receptor n=1 Tax=Gallaecimonas pentaromativorans TaxID=584787 RepID=UPI00067EB8DB|nr:TonB-dependent receptor [Gallaecimonas pentaromativorans]MED5525918.1 TonB-dependent receptor [Pseudomonadota bacterium]